MSVLPCPGVRAWPAPSATAVSSETMRTSGVTSAVRKIEGKSPLVTPPGTAPAAATEPTADGDAGAPTAAPATGDGVDVAPGSADTSASGAPGTGSASG